MISDPVERWRLRLGDSTWTVYRTHWERFLEVMKIADPKELLTLSSNEASDLAAEYFDVLSKRGFASKTCNLGYTTVRSFFSHNGIRLEKFGKKFAGYVEYEQGFLMTQQQVFQLIEAVPKWRYKFTTGVCFQGGQRRGICTALKFCHIDTRDWQNATVVLFTVPRFLPNANKKNMNKYNVKYRFALLDDVIRYLVLHVQERERIGEKITPDSWLVTMPNSGKPPAGRFINTAIKEAAERIGIQRYRETALGGKKALIHAHIGRIYFKTQLRQAGVDPELRDFLMGHKMPYAGAYDRYPEAEIVAAIEQARARLALVPESINKIEERRQKIIHSVRQVLPPEDLEWLKNQLAFAETDEQIDEILDNFKNGRVKLEPIKR